MKVRGAEMTNTFLCIDSFLGFYLHIMRNQSPWIGESIAPSLKLKKN